MKRSFPWNWAAWPLALVAGAGVMSAAPEKHPATYAAPDVEAHADAGQALVTLASWVPGTLPTPHPRQRKPPCRTQIAEEAINGYCWIRIDVKPPCAPGEAFEHNGRCYLQPSADVPTPNAGEPAPRAIAD